MRSSILLLAIIAGAFAYTTGADTYICEVAYPNFCAGGVDPCPAAPTIPLNGVAYDLGANFNVIDFGDFNVSTGDVEGRLIVGGNFIDTAGGYSVGAELWNKGANAWDLALPYSLVIAGDFTLASGAVYPLGAVGDYHPATTEKVFVGGAIKKPTPGYIADLKTNTAAASTIQTPLVAAQSFYQSLSDAFAAVQDNVIVGAPFKSGILVLSCNSVTATSYSVTVPSSTFNMVTSYNFIGCNPKAQLVINIAGTGNVIFRGAAIANTSREPERTLYNVVGAGRNVYLGTTNGKQSGGVGGSIMGSLLAPNCAFTGIGGVITGITIVGSISNADQFNRLHCAAPQKPTTPPAYLCPGFETDCAGLFSSVAGNAVNFRDFNVLSFGDYTADTGDIEGRLAVQRDVKLGAGYSVGAVIDTFNNLKDGVEAFSIIAGRDVTFISGAVMPDTSSASPSGIFAGRNFVGADYLAPRVTGTCQGVDGCLDSVFTAAAACYNGYNTLAAAKKENVQQTVQYDALILTCADNSAVEYVVNVDAAILPTFTYYSTVNCNYDAYWIINIVGTGDVYFSGDSMPAPSGAVVYNVVGSRTVHVTDTSLNGHLLAPQATLSQTGGVIQGKVVAANIVMALQINKQNTCPVLTAVRVNIIATRAVAVGDFEIEVAQAGDLIAGDNIQLVNGQSTKIRVVNFSRNVIVVEDAVDSAIPAGRAGSVPVNPSQSRYATPEPTSSAAVVTFAAALFAIVALFL